MPSVATLQLDGPVATITLSSDNPVISLSSEILDSLGEALDEIEADKAIRCVVLTGSGPTFIVGADIKEIHGLSVVDSLAYNQRLIDLAERLETIAPPVVACLNGSAFGGGLEFALACSVRIASADAVMGLPEVKLGIVPGAGGTVRLPRAVAPGAALGMMLTGRTVGAAEAREMGLVDEVVAAPELLQRGRRLATEISERAPLAVNLIKRAVRETADMPVAAAVAEVQIRLGGLLESEDSREGIAAFLEKRSPDFKGI